MNKQYKLKLYLPEKNKPFFEVDYENSTWTVPIDSDADDVHFGFSDGTLIHTIRDRDNNWQSTIAIRGTHTKITIKSRNDLEYNGIMNYTLISAVPFKWYGILNTSCVWFRFSN